MWGTNNTMSMPLIILSVCLFSLSVSYITLAYKFNNVSKQYKKIFVEMMVLEKLIDNIEESKIKTDESVHKENFIKFLSDSRDWAYKYIEDVQSGLSNFINEIEPEINYFNEYGDVGSMSPNYYSMKKIVAEYKKLKTFLPKEEEAK
jgi:hypothetical protein